MSQQLANKVTVDSINERVAGIRFTRLEGETTTLCSIRMVNGFVVHGISNCVDPRNFDKDVGERIAYKNAFEQLWALEGYLLSEQIYLTIGQPVEFVQGEDNASPANDEHAADGERPTDNGEYSESEGGTTE